MRLQNAKARVILMLDVSYEELTSVSERSTREKAKLSGFKIDWRRKVRFDLGRVEVEVDLVDSFRLVKMNLCGR